MKTCKRCLEDKPVSEFYPRKGGKDGFDPHCKICEADYKLQRKYGLEPGQYARMLEDQNGTCAICQEPPTTDNTKYGKLLVDHDHKTGKVRALLCDNCNKAIGFLKDDPGLAVVAAVYLIHHEDSQLSKGAFSND